MGATVPRSSMAGWMMKMSIMRRSTAWILLGGIALSVSQFQAQAPHPPVSAVRVDPPKSHPLAIGTGATVLTAKQIADIETRVRAVLARQPGNPAALTAMGSVRLQQRNFPAAIGYLEQARQIQPGNKAVAAKLDTARFRFYMDEGHRSLASNQLSAAERRYLSALELHPDSRQAFLGLHATLVKALRAQRAIPPPQHVAPALPQQLVAQTPVALPPPVAQTPAAEPQPAAKTTVAETHTAAQTPPDSTQEVVYGPFVPYVPPWIQPQASAGLDDPLKGH
jgi:tetratricopeptide (TPR) repeat protein